MIKRSKGGTGLTIHRLIHPLLKIEMRDEVIEAAIECTTEWIDETWKKVGHFLLEAFPKPDISTNLPACREMQDQAIGLLMAIPEFNWKDLRRLWERVGQFLH